jgi:SAM-dependent methyltransferase
VTAALYDRIGHGYSNHRRPDPRISALIGRALENCDSVVNVGAGTGSYAPQGGHVVAVELSETMIRQRPVDSAPFVRADAMALPFRDHSFSAAMAILTIHHWPDRDSGIREMKRVARDRVLILTWEPPHTPFWLMRDYLPHFLEYDRKTFPPWFRDDPDTLAVTPVPVPHDCTDGFLCAYWRRPEAYLDAGIRNAISTFSRVGGFESGLDRLRSDLNDGTWHRRYGHLLEKTELDLGYRLVALSAHRR